MVRHCSACQDDWHAAKPELNFLPVLDARAARLPYVRRTWRLAVNPQVPDLGGAVWTAVAWSYEVQQLQRRGLQLVAHGHGWLAVGERGRLEAGDQARDDHEKVDHGPP